MADESKKEKFTVGNLRKLFYFPTEVKNILFLSTTTKRGVKWVGFNVPLNTQSNSSVEISAARQTNEGYNTLKLMPVIPGQNVWIPRQAANAWRMSSHGTHFFLLLNIPQLQTDGDVILHHLHVSSFNQQLLHIQSIYVNFSLRVIYPCLVAKYYIATLQRQAIKVNITTKTFAH